MRRVFGWLARRRLLPAQGRYLVMVYTPQNMALRCDYATPQLAGEWFAGLIECGAFDAPPGRWESRLEVYPVRPCS